MILGFHTITLTKKQAAELRKFWSKTTDGKGTSFCIGQPAIRCGPFWVNPMTVTFGIMDKASGDAIDKALNSTSGGAK